MIAAKTENAIPFDVPNVELGHHDTQCSFDAVIKKYHLTDTHSFGWQLSSEGPIPTPRNWRRSVQDSRLLLRASGWFLATIRSNWRASCRFMMRFMPIVKERSRGNKISLGLECKKVKS